jgi:hypothetical protein
VGGAPSARGGCGQNFEGCGLHDVVTVTQPHTLQGVERTTFCPIPDDRPTAGAPSMFADGERRTVTPNAQRAQPSPSGAGIHQLVSQEGAWCARHHDGDLGSRRPAPPALEANGEVTAARLPLRGRQQRSRPGGEELNNPVVCGCQHRARRLHVCASARRVAWSRGRFTEAFAPAATRTATVGSACTS